jgi:hypothetical protein
MTQPMMWMGLGAGLMYYLDPDQGWARRARGRARFVHLMNEIEHEIEVASRDIVNRTQGVIARSRSLATDGGAPDGVIADRVRSRLGRVVSHPRAIEVTVRGQHVVLSGPILAEEAPRLCFAVRSVRGVKSVEDRLQVCEWPGDHPALQDGRPRRHDRFDLRPEAWSPTMRLLAGTAIGVAVLRLAGSGGLAGTAIGALGASLVSSRSTEGRRQRGRHRRSSEGGLRIATGAPIGDVAIPARPSRVHVPDLGP